MIDTIAFEGCLVSFKAKSVVMTDLKKGEVFIVEGYSERVYKFDVGDYVTVWHEPQMYECESIYYWDFQLNDSDPVRHIPGKVYSKEGPRFEATLCHRVVDIK